ncbi:hypothetical protein GCM10009819_26770 [Agromyces tropicus]|uniref:DUF4192 family protein n=1 Tax=Agromyces tropicus TaxID=555371 RepID=A0ABN2UNQ6_9MICO
MTATIRAETAHDFLALVPHLVGYRPARSLVCVAFEGARTVGVVRHDLPDAATIDATAGAILGTLCRMPRVDAAVVVAYVDESFGGGGVPVRGVIEAIAHRLETAGFAVRDALCVAADGWGSLLDASLPPGGRRMELIEGSRAARRARKETGRPPATTAADLVVLPEPRADLAEPIRGVLDGLDGTSRDDGALEDRVGEALDAIEAAVGAAADPLVLVERVAAGDARSPEELGWLLHLSAQPPIRDAMMLQAAFGPLIGELALDAAAEPETAGVGSPAHDVAPDRAGAEPVDDVLARLLLGRSCTRPDPGRVHRSLEVVTLAIGNAPAGRRSGALCIAAWLAWALGRGSAAGALVDLARAETPEHTMAALLERFLGTGALPDWAFTEPDAAGAGAGGRPAAGARR